MPNPEPILRRALRPLGMWMPAVPGTLAAWIGAGVCAGLALRVPLWLAVLLSVTGVSRAASRTVHHGGHAYAIDVWTTDDGLPQGSVIALTQSRDGYLWLGTLGGLVRFDGRQFTVFDDRNTAGLPSRAIVCLFEDSRSNLWVGTRSDGAVLLQNGRVTGLDIGRGTSDGRLRSVCEDASGAVWMYTADGQLCRHRDGRVDIWNLGGETGSRCRSLAASDSGSVIVGTDWRLYTIGPTAGLDPQTLPAEETPLTNRLDYLLTSRQGGAWRLIGGQVQHWGARGLERNLGPFPWTNAPVVTACEDPEGNLVVGTLGAGLFWFDATGGVTRLSESDGLSHNYILSLAFDREGSLWVGTDPGGLNRIKRLVFDVQEASRGLTVQSVTEDLRGGLWLALNVLGVDHWQDGVRTRHRLSYGAEDLPIREVLADRSGQVWAGTLGGGLYRFQAGQFQRVAGTESMLRMILALHEDRQGALWVGTSAGLARHTNGLWTMFTARDGLVGDAVQAIADDAQGNLWAGTARGGLNRWRDGQFAHYRKADGLPADDVASLCVDSDGILWVGTSAGLGRFDGRHWTRYTMRDGLVSDTIGYLVDDGQGYLWIGSNAGLMRVARQALNDLAGRGEAARLPLRAYGRPEGLPTRECTQGSQPGAWLGHSGRLWLPTTQGLGMVDPAQIFSNPHPPPVVIEAVVVGQELQNTNRLRTGSPAAVVMPAGRERLEFHFTSLNLAAPDRARFRYRLEPHDSSWIETADTRIARYSRVPPGEYRFQVTACNEDGVWNPTASVVAVTVLPPFWQTWWFLSLSAATLLGFLIATVHYFSTQRLQRQLEGLRQQQALEKERARIARDIHDQLGANLTQVALLGELVEGDKDSPADIEEHARQITRTARDTARALDEIVWAANPSNDSLDGLVTYLSKHAQDYLAVAGLRCRLEVPPQLPGAPLPPDVRHNVFLAAKEALTNVVRHARASEVHVRLRVEPGRFVLEIQDNGRGPAGVGDPAARLRNGMRNMRKRMEDIGGQFEIAPAPEGGTLVRLTGPLH